MSLARSLATTLLIVIVVWGAAFLGSAAHRVEAPVADSSIASPSLQLVGVSESVDLAAGSDEINAAWQRFYDMNALHGSLDPARAARVYGYYRFDDADPNRASLTIGYDAPGSGSAEFPVLARLTRDDYQLIFQSTDSWDTAPAWAQIDADRPLHSVLEEYELNGSEVVTARVYVNYREIE